MNRKGQAMSKSKPYDKLKVRLDKNTGMVNLTISYQELRCILTGDCNNAYSQLEQLKTCKEYYKDEHIAYYKGNIKRAKAIETLIDQQARPYIYEDEVVALQGLTKAQRLAKVKEEIKERKFLDSILEKMLAEAPKRKKRKAKQCAKD